MENIILGALVLGNIIVIVYFLFLAQKIMNIENEVEYLSRRVKINGAYQKLIAYSSAPPEDLIVLAQTKGLFTDEQIETLKPMVDTLKQLHTSDEIVQPDNQQTI